MRLPSFKLSLACRSGFTTLCVAASMTFAFSAAAKNRPIKKLSYNPSAATVELFEGIEEGSLEATLIPKDSMGGNVFIENKTDKPLTVKFPKAVAAQQVLKQGFGGGAGGGGRGGAGGGMGGGMGGMGGGQMMGGGMGGMGGGMMGGMGGGMGMMGGMGGMGGGMGGGFFSIPPEKTVQVPITTVCLNHGKPEPRARMTYKLVKLEDYTKDPVLQELLVMVASGDLDHNKQAAQAAAWNLTDKMSWEKLAAKEIDRIVGENDPYFSQAELLSARELVVQAQARARERGEEAHTETEPASTPKKRVPETKRRRS